MGENVEISFPAPAASGPSITKAILGEAALVDDFVIWRIPMLKSGEDSGTLEFSAHADSAELFPATFKATQRTPTCLIEVLGCYHQESGEEIGFACESSRTYEFTISI